MKRIDPALRQQSFCFALYSPLSSSPAAGGERTERRRRQAPLRCKRTAPTAAPNRVPAIRGDVPPRRIKTGPPGANARRPRFAVNFPAFHFPHLIRYHTAACALPPAHTCGRAASGFLPRPCLCPFPAGLLGPLCRQQKSRAVAARQSVSSFDGARRRHFTAAGAQFAILFFWRGQFWQFCRLTLRCRLCYSHLGSTRNRRDMHAVDGHDL